MPVGAIFSRISWSSNRQARQPRSNPPENGYRKAAGQRCPQGVDVRDRQQFKGGDRLNPAMGGHHDHDFGSPKAEID